MLPYVEAGVIDPDRRPEAGPGPVQHLAEAPLNGCAQRLQVELTRWPGHGSLVEDDQRGDVHRQAVVLDAQVARVQLAEPLKSAALVPPAAALPSR